MTNNHEEDKNKNYYLTMGIIIAFLIFMVGTVLLVSHQVNQGSSAKMLKKKTTMLAPGTLETGKRIENGILIAV